MVSSSSSSAMRLAVFLAVCVFFMSSVSGKIYLTKKMTIKILNGLPNNDHLLNFRCQSGDKDLGMLTLRVGEDYLWKFHNNFFDKTLWFCHFYWGDKDRVFEVYNDDRNYPQCADDPHKTSGSTCYWLVKEDGFYSSDQEQDYGATDREHKGARQATWVKDDGPFEHIHPPPPPPY